MMRIRAVRPGDEAAVADICARTAAHGRDGRGLLSEDGLWAEVFALPYIARHPELAFVVVAEADEPLGYVVGTSDTESFDIWFRHWWWPSRRPLDPVTDGPEALLLSFASARGTTSDPMAKDHPAELHIDLLPAVQGGGCGRKLMDAFLEGLRAAGVPGVRLGVSTVNTGAGAFYSRLGFSVLSESPDTVRFGLRLGTSRRDDSGRTDG